MEIYSGFFLDLPIEGQVHVTWDFNPGSCELPKGVIEDDIVFIDVVGDYEDTEVKCLIVNVQLSSGRTVSVQPTGTVLHITTWTAPGISPVESGLRATKNGWTKRTRDGQKKFVRHMGRAGFFRRGK